MSVTETNKIDIVATRPDSSIVRLVIADHLDWSDFESHARVLQDKINTYLEFIESGRLAQSMALQLSETPRIHIEVALQHPPTEEANGFFESVRNFLSDVSVAFDVSVRAST